MNGSDALVSILGAGGRLARALGSYEERPQQVEMARVALAALHDGTHALIEAGTGTGKTLAYLVPALLSGKKVVVSTATKTLQDQIFFKDIPLLARALGVEIPAAYMKGRGNYLCKLRYEGFCRDPRFASREEAAIWPKVVEWAESTATGDRAELDLPETFATWREISATAEQCLGQRCPHWDECFVTEMRRRAQEARIVVVNHHLFFADAALRTREGEPGVEVIPRADAVIFDEAHALEDVATAHFGVQVSTYRMHELAHDTRRALPEEARPLFEPLVVAVEQRAAGLFSALEERTGLLFSARQGEGVARVGPQVAEAVARERDELLSALEELGEAASSEPAPEVKAIARRCLAIAAELRLLTDVREGGAHVHFLERRGRGLFLQAAPIEVDGELARRVWSQLPSAILTSATLTVDGSFDHVARRLGLGREGSLSRLRVESPFDYRRQCALYLPRHLPDPQDPAFVDRAAAEIERLVEVTGGRAFALFTSVRNMNRAHELLAPRLPYRVLLQGQLPKARLLSRFVEEPSVLFATASFWEGVDVPGPALSLVVIDRLPFASPGHPLVAARIEALRRRGVDPFAAYQLPQAAIALRQGFGRLVRSRSDRGIVAILDRRIVTRGYGRTFLRTLPDVARLGRLEEVQAWWDQEESSESSSSRMSR